MRQSLNSQSNHSRRMVQQVIDESLVPSNSKLSQRVVDIICKYLSQGNYLTVACEAAGIDTVTLRRWAARAEDGEEPYVAVVQQLKEAEAKAEALRLSRIDKAGDKSWQALAWILERTKPQKYGQTTRVHSVVELAPETKDYLSRLAESRLRLQAAEIIEGEVIEVPAVTDGTDKEVIDG